MTKQSHNVLINIQPRAPPPLPKKKKKKETKAVEDLVENKA